MPTFVVRKGSLTRDEYLQVDGTTGDYKTAQQFGSQDTADIAGRSVYGEDFGVFPKSRAKRTVAMRGDQFKALVVRYLLSIGAVYDNDESHPYTLNTPFGPLGITPYTDWIACRFVCNKAAQSWGCNPHSGKWNHHGSDLDALFYAFTRDVERLLDCPLTAENRRAVAEGLIEDKRQTAKWAVCQSEWNRFHSSDTFAREGSHI